MAVIASESASVLLNLNPLNVYFESMEKNISTMFNQLADVDMMGFYIIVIISVFFHSSYR